MFFFEVLGETGGDGLVDVEDSGAKFAKVQGANGCGGDDYPLEQVQRRADVVGNGQANEVGVREAGDQVFGMVILL